MRDHRGEDAVALGEVLIVEPRHLALSRAHEASSCDAVTGSGLNRSAFATLKIAVLPPIAIASVRMARPRTTGSAQ
jgi:hypothetical protein